MVTGPAALLAWGVATAGAAPPPAPATPATLVYYNARMALEDGDPVESVKLWLVRNVLEDRDGTVAAGDGDFHSVVWAATGALGICQDGLPRDEDGAGLWPLALHNHIVRNLGRRDRLPRPKTFSAFGVGRQQRAVALGDVLGWQELETVRFVRGRCARPVVHQVLAGESAFAPPADRAVTTRLLARLLRKSTETLGPDVRGRSVVEARLFDLELQLLELAQQRREAEARRQAREGQGLGLGRLSLASLVAGQPTTFLSSPSRAVLEDCLTWSAHDWMALSAERRRFVFDAAAEDGAPRAALDTVALSILDALLARGDGREATEWIARVGVPPVADPRVWSGPRGQALLALGPDSGFTERGPVALHRGVHLLETGQTDDALRAFGFALQQAPDSRAAAAVAQLSRRWIAYLAARFSLTDTLLATLETLLPRRDFAVLLEDLLWHAALRADEDSFRRGLVRQPSRGALDRRLVLLAPLASGDSDAFVAGLDRRFAEGESEAMRFLSVFAERLEREDASVRTALVPTLVALRARAERLRQGQDSGRTARAAEAFLARTQGILEGAGFDSTASALDAARARSHRAEVYAGAVRLAPSDALPWPFRPTPTAAPSALSQLTLAPETWQDDSGQTVLGWSIRE